MSNAELTFLSWNLALLERSAEAPSSVQQFHIEDAIRTTILALEPDIVCFQELPNMVPFVETLDLLQATTRSHSGRMATLVWRDTAGKDNPEIVAVDGIGLLTTFPEREGRPAFTIANVHLEPGAGGTGRRLEQLSTLVSESPTERLLVLGDTNTRIADVEHIEAAGFIAPKPPSSTWNSRKNQFRHGGAEFTAYFTRAFASPGIEISDQVVHDSPAQMDGSTFYWSDHFALSGIVQVVSE